MSVSSCFTFPLRFAEQVKLNNLSQCNCCLRHQINKPSELKPWVELHSTHNRDNPCQCDCRHRARWICREMCGNSLVAAHVGVVEEPTDFDSVMDRLEKNGTISSTERESFVKLMMDQNEVAQAAYEVFELDNDEEEMVDTLRRINKPIDSEYYVPVLPFVLVNVYHGIGTGVTSGSGFASSSSDEEAEEYCGGESKTEW